MSLTRIVATFAFVITLTVAFSSSSELQAQSGSRSVGDVVGGIAGSGSRSLPSVVTDFGGTQDTFGSYVAPQAEYSGAPVTTQYSPAPISSGPVYSSAPASSDCGCGAPAPVAAPLPVASPCGGGCGGGCSGGGCGGGCPGRACGNKDFGNLRRAQATGLRGGLFQRGRPCNGGCN